MARNVQNSPLGVENSGPRYTTFGIVKLGLVAYFRPLASARPLGARRIELAILQSATRIDDADAAWNDTFSHPDSTHSPYLGVSGYLSRGHERTDRVDLEDENVLGVQAMAGVAASISVLRLGAEVNLARVPGYAFKVAFGI